MIASISRLRDVRWIALSALPVAAAGFVGTLATIPNIPTWYAGLAKPPFTPPNGVFGPAWTVLYVAMACGVFRIFRRPADAPGRTAALAVFYGQLALNAAWSWAFFGARSPTLGMIVIVVLFGAILMTVRAFRRLDTVAAALLVPYGVWVAFATYLNLGILVLNR